MSTNYSPTIVTDGAVFVGDARTSSTATAGSRLYDQAGVDSTAVKLLIHGNEGSGQSFTDSSLSNHTITAVGNTTHSTTKTKFSGGSIYFDGTGDKLSVADNADWHFGSGDFTVDMWINGSTFTHSSYPALFSQYIDDNNFLALYFGTSGSRLYLWGRNAGSAYSTLEGQVTWSTDTWYHVAVVRNGTTSYLFRDGILIDSVTESWTASDLASPFYVGWWGYGGTDYSFNGYIDEFRVTKGAALWTQNFTPPARRDTLSISDGMMYNGSCIDLDGTDDCIDFGADTTFSTGAYTVLAWVKSDDTTHTYIQNIVGKSNNNVGYFCVHTSGKLAYWDYGGGVWRYGNTVLTSDVWHHVVMVYDGDDGGFFYLDGVADSAELGYSGTTAQKNGVLRYIGANQDSGSPSNDRFWLGEMADVRIYDTPLSAANIKELYDDSKVIVPQNVSQTNLKGWWPLAEGAGTLCYDGSGNGQTGTITNGEGDEWLTGQTGCPQLVEGYNRPMTFDGLAGVGGDYVSIPLTLPADNYTVSSWVNFGTSTLLTYWFDSRDTTYTGAMGVYTEESSNKHRIQVYMGGAVITTGYVISENVWTHLCLTKGGADIELFIDGVSVGTDGGNTNPTNSATFTLGGRFADPSNTTNHFDGLINEAVVYNSTLSLAQVQALAATGPNGGPLPPDPMSLSNSSNVVGYWRNDGNVTWTDRSGNGNTGTVNGSPDTLLFKQGINGSASTSTGRDGQGFPLKYQNNGAIGFNGIDATGDYIDCGDLGTISDEFTYSVWFKTGPSTAATYRMFMCVDGNTNGNPQLRIYNGNVQMRFYSDNSLASSGTYWDGEWHQAVGGINGSGDYFLYVDGVSQGTLTPISYTLSWSGNTRIGKYNYAGGKFFEGQIANALIYNRALSEAEIQQNYKAQRSRFE